MLSCLITVSRGKQDEILKPAGMGFSVQAVSILLDFFLLLLERRLGKKCYKAVLFA